MLSKLLPIALVLAIVLAACGDSSDSSDATASDDQMTDTSMAEDDMTDEAMAEDSMSGDMTDSAMSGEDMEHPATSFTVTITNSSGDGPLPTPLAPGVFAVHTSMDTLFADGQEDRGQGLQELAEDGDPSALVATLNAESTVSVAGVFSNPDGGAEPGPALPGSSYSFTFDATPGDYLSLATMFVQSNDWFFASPPSGINLFQDGAALEGDISDLISLWDAGTEVDETPGEGANQAPRQAAPDTGGDEGAPIAPVSGYAGAVTVTISVNG